MWPEHLEPHVAAVGPSPRLLSPGRPRVGGPFCRARCPPAGNWSTASLVNPRGDGLHFMTVEAVTFNIYFDVYTLAVNSGENLLVEIVVTLEATPLLLPWPHRFI